LRGWRLGADQRVTGECERGNDRRRQQDACRYQGLHPGKIAPGGQRFFTACAISAIAALSSGDTLPMPKSPPEAWAI
jgi:hypothetical protein